MIKKIIDFIGSWRLRTQLIGAFFLFATIPSLCIYTSVMHYYRNDLINGAVQNVHSVLQTDNVLIDTVLEQIENVSYTLVGNDALYASFSQLENATASTYPQIDREVSFELAKQFSALDMVYETSFYTPQRIFAQDGNRTKLDIEVVKKTDLPQIAQQAKGTPEWVTGYDFGNYFHSDYLMKKDDYEYQYLLTMVKEMNFQYIESSVYHSLPEGVDPPILMVHLLEEDFRKLYSGSVEYPETISFVVNENGDVISSDHEWIPIAEPLPQSVQKAVLDSGIQKIFYKGTQWLMCHDTIGNRQWQTVAMIPMEQVVQEAQEKITVIHMVVLSITLVSAVLMAVLLGSTISKPIRALIGAAHRVSMGDFSANTPVPRGKDFRVLTENFNSMEKEINRLINENYAIALREKDAQIMALSLQINPHFLYNTLNTINMLALEHDEEEISDVIVNLSEMLHYTFRNNQEKVSLMDEVHWVDHYVMIMSKRYENVFEFHTEIDRDAQPVMVPKFFLQPLVENSIIHGFDGISSGGKLTIAARCHDGYLIFSIKDNGTGMSEEQRDNLLSQENPSGSIGVSNVHQRLKLIYGDKYQIDIISELGKGTEIIIRLPCDV